MNMRKIIAVLAAVLMLCAIVPMNVFAAPGDIVVNKNFDDGKAFSNGSCENGYMVFDATTADWANVYYYANNIKSGNKYEITFDAKANKATNINVKINNNWGGDTFKWTTNITTEWATYTTVINPDELKPLTATALLMFTSNTTAANGAVYHIDNVVVKEYTDPATIGQVKNGDFETGNKSNWSGSATVVAEGYNGGYAAKLSNPGQWSEALIQTVPVEANTVYEITWMSKRLSGSGAFNLVVCQTVSPWGHFSKVAGQNWMNETSGNWVTNSYTVNSGNNTSMLLKFTTEATNPGEILLDNIVVSKVKDPSDDGFIKNGDFETGKVAPWTVYSGKVDADSAKSGDYGLHITHTSGNWNGTAYQDFTVEAGKTYVVMMDAKALSKGQNIQIQNGGANKASKWFTTTSWTTLTFEFTADATNSRINICGGGTGSNEEIYVDNVFVFEKKAASNDGYIVNGDFENGTMEGLAPSSQTTISREAAKDGNFGLHLKNQAGNWGGVGLWTINNLEAGATYKFEMDMKAVSKGLNWTLWQDATNSGTKYANGYFSTAAWTHIEKEFVANTNVAVLNINGGNTGVSEEVYLDNLKITLVKPAHTCEFVGTVTKEPTCTEPGEKTYACTCGEGTYTETIPAYHNNNMQYTPAKDATDCAHPGNIENWYCPGCNEYFSDAYAVSILNPWFIEITVDCVRPEGLADCATVTCETCGNDIIGYGEHDVLACQGGTCSKCNTEIEGYGCANYDTPACEDGVCYYCGGFVAGFGHENGAWSPCCDGECAYGCGLIFPATEDHVDADADDYCDNCWNHLNHDVDPCVGGECSICWTYIEGAHTYDNDFDADCNICGDIREIECPITGTHTSVSEDVSGLAFKFELSDAISGLTVQEGTKFMADYTNATVGGYKLITMGAVVSNNGSTTHLESVDGVHVVKVAADKVDVTENYFAVRIIKIPQAARDTVITARPYFVYENEAGEQITVYGAEVSNTYNGALGN